MEATKGQSNASFSATRIRTSCASLEAQTASSSCGTSDRGGASETTEATMAMLHLWSGNSTTQTLYGPSSRLPPSNRASLEGEMARSTTQTWLETSTRCSTNRAGIQSPVLPSTRSSTNCGLRAPTTVRSRVSTCRSESWTTQLKVGTQCLLYSQRTRRRSTCSSQISNCKACPGSLSTIH